MDRGSTGLAEKRHGALFTRWGVGQVLEFLDLEPFHRHRLALVAGPVDDGAAPALAQDTVVVLVVLQLAVLQEESAGSTARGSDRTSAAGPLPPPRGAH